MKPETQEIVKLISLLVLIFSLLGTAIMQQLTIIEQGRLISLLVAK